MAGVAALADVDVLAGEPQRIAPVAAARAEAAWWSGRIEAVLDQVREAYEFTFRSSNPWWPGELAFWLWRGGALADAPEGIAAPYALQIAGEWRAAAEAWGATGCPYEQAMALADGDETARREALTIFERLQSMLRKSYGTDEVLAARPTAEYDARWGDPEVFVTLAFHSLWGHLRDAYETRLGRIP